MTSRYRLVGALAGALLAFLLIPACTTQGDTGKDSDDASDKSVTTAALALGDTPGIHVEGTWSGHFGSRTFSVDVLADGLAVGSISDDGQQVQVLAGERFFWKSTQAFWGSGGANHARDYFGDQWVEVERMTSPLSLFSPRVLADDLLRADSTGASFALPPGEPERPPAGVSADAVGVVTGPGHGSALRRVYWLTPSAPHRLVGYAGTFQADETFAAMTRALTNKEAGDAYLRAAGLARQLPAQVISQSGSERPIPLFVVSDIDVEGCVSVCHVTVTGGPTAGETVWVAVEVMLEGANRAAGSCRIELSVASPGEEVNGSCDVSGPEIDQIRRESPLVVVWSSRSDITGYLEYVKVDGPTWAAELTRQGQDLG